MKNKRKAAGKAGVLICILLFFTAAYSGTFLVKDIKEDYDNQSTFMEVQRIYAEGNKKNKKKTVVYDDALSSLIKENSHTKAYIYIPDTTLEYPVMQNKDEPNFYLNRDFYKRYSAYGTPYMDARCDMDSDNIIIYGHNIVGGRVFGVLLQYGNYDFYEAHRTLYLDTSNEKREYKIIAVIKDTDISSCYTFINAADKKEYDNYIAYVKEHSVYECKITSEYGTQLITLSTCDNAGGNSRFIVVAARTN